MKKYCGHCKYFCRIYREFFCRFCGDFPVNSRLLTFKAYIFFSCNIYMCTWSEKLWVFQATCNPCHNYVHVAGYPVWHGDFLHFLRGKNLQCIYNFVHTLDKVLDNWVIVLLKEIYLNSLIQARNTQTAIKLLLLLVKSARRLFHV